jgi:hypothetical protein
MKDKPMKQLLLAQPTLSEEQINAIMSQVQVFASAWSRVGGWFDSGQALVDANEAKAELRAMLAKAQYGRDPITDEAVTLAVDRHSKALLAGLTSTKAMRRALEAYADRLEQEDA